MQNIICWLLPNQIIMYFYVCFLSIIVICIDNCKWLCKELSCADNSMAEKLDLNELVSMNMWGLTPAFMDTLYDGFVEFLQNVKAGDIKAEYLLPVMIDALIQKGTAQVDVLETKDTWFGVTYQEDKEVVIKAFKELTEAGVYPNGLYK